MRQLALSPSLWLDKEIAEHIHSTGWKNESPKDFRNDLNNWVSRKLCKTILTAAEQSLYYTTHLADHAKALQALAEYPPYQDAMSILTALPFTLPEAIASNSEEFLSIGHSDVAGLITVPSSGTTGPNKRIFCSQADLLRTIRFFQYGMRLLLSKTHGQRVALLMSGQRPGSVGHLLSEALRAWNIPCDVYGLPHDMEQCARQLAAQRPTCIVGLPGHILSLARHSVAPELRECVQSLLLSGEYASPALRKACSDAFQCPVFNHYGLTEAGLAGAVDCAQLQGCHIRESDLLFSVIDTYGNTLPDGEWGELVLTTLTREAMPLVRYKTGDAGRLLSAPCPCGSIIKRVETAGRLEHCVTLASSKRLTLADLDDILFSFPWVTGYEATLHTPQNMPSYLALKLFTTASLPDTELHACALKLNLLSGIHATPFCQTKGQGLPFSQPQWVAHGCHAELLPVFIFYAAAPGQQQNGKRRIHHSADQGIIL